MPTNRAAIHCYTNRQPYRSAVGHAPDQTPRVRDRMARRLAVVDLENQPSAARFVRCIRREMRIRCYQPTTIKTYLRAVTSLLRWLGRPPHLLDREHVREYLEYLCDSGLGSSELSVQLCAIRMAWDKMCMRDVTLGLETPRKPRRRPVILSREEVQRLLAAAPSRRDSMLIGIMYGSGLRVSEVSRLKWSDVNLDRRQLRVFQGKGRADRYVHLPRQLFRVLTQRTRSPDGNEYLFPSLERRSEERNKHVSARTVQRAVATAARLAGLDRKVTPHLLRHSFATHSFENGCDIRRIQTVLGHVRLDTTTLYVQVSRQRTAMESPLDRLPVSSPEPRPTTSTTSRKPDSATSKKSGSSKSSVEQPVGRMRVHMRRDPAVSDAEFRRTRRRQVTVELQTGNPKPTYLTGTIASFARPGLVQIELPSEGNWEQESQALPSRVRERLRQPEFFQTLQRLVTNRFLATERKKTPKDVSD